jgi:hypothetical protein
MTRARVGALSALALILAVALIATLRSGQKYIAARPQSERPALLLLTSLPIMFGEGFSLESNGSAALTALETRYRVVPISTAAADELAKGSVLLMAHAPAQTPDNLVALDQWVRNGGKVLLLADPMLEWPSQRPLGDPLRPSPVFPDTGLLQHWGLRLDAPDRPGLQVRKVGGEEVLTDSPGTLVGKCDIASEGLVADCSVEKGRAVVLADADFLDTEQLGEPAKHNLDVLLKELAKLERE